MSRFAQKVSRKSGQNTGTGLARAIAIRDIVPSRIASRIPISVSRIVDLTSRRFGETCTVVSRSRCSGCTVNGSPRGFGTSLKDMEPVAGAWPGRVLSIDSQKVLSCLQCRRVNHIWMCWCASESRPYFHTRLATCSAPAAGSKATGPAIARGRLWQRKPHEQDRLAYP